MNILQSKFFITLYIATLCFLPKQSVAGDPLANLGLFFENAFRLQFDSPDVIKGTEKLYLDAPPPDYNWRKAVKIRYPIRKLDHTLLCSDVELLNYNDWKVETEKAINLSNEREPWEDITRDMHYQGFGDWDSPVDVNSFAHVSFWGMILFGQMLRSVDVSVAVLGDDFDINAVVNQDDKKFTDTTLERLFSINGYNFDGLYENFLAGKTVKITDEKKCSGFTIYEMRIG